MWQSVAANDPRERQLNQGTILKILVNVVFNFKKITDKITVGQDKVVKYLITRSSLETRDGKGEIYNNYVFLVRA